MPNVRTQCREAYTPRTLSKAILRALVKALVDFKPGLPTTSRKIRARAISAGKTTDLEGPESWKVTDPHSLADLEHVRVELSLTSAEHRRCELHVEFQPERRRSADAHLHDRVREREDCEPWAGEESDSAD